MKKTYVINALALTVALSTGILIGAQKPVQNVNPLRHPNIAAAQSLCSQAYNKVVQAQNDHEFDLGGHAQKAKELLSQASQELTAAAQVANHK